MTPTPSTHTSLNNPHETRSRASDSTENVGRPSTPRVSADRGSIPATQVDKGDTGLDNTENDDHSKASRASKKGHGSPVPTPKADSDGNHSSTSDDSEDDNHSRASRPDGNHQPDSAQQPEVNNSTRRRRRKSKRKTMGIHRPEYVVKGSDPFDYEQKFPEDKRHEEMGPMARVWRTLLEECGPFDLEMAEGWRDALDVLLVFAGLFSAVVTTFVAQTSQSLQVDYGQVTATLLIELIDVQRSAANGSLVNNVPRSDLTFRPSTSDSWVNGLWFTSLSLSLSTALFAVLIKQWIHQYMSVQSGTPRDRCRLHQFRYMGLQRWGVDLIIGLLPVLMSMSLALFLVGLVLFIIPLRVSIASVVGSVTFIAFAAYLITNFLPVLYPSCPYKTPLTHYIFPLYAYITHKISFKWIKLGDDTDKSSSLPKPATLKDAEITAVKQYADETDVHALSGLYSMSSNPSVQYIVVQSTSALPLKSVALLQSHIPDLLQICLSHLRGLVRSTIPYHDCGPEGPVDCLTRVCLRFASYWNSFNISGVIYENMKCRFSLEIYAQYLCIYGHGHQIQKLFLPDTYHESDIIDNLHFEPIVWAHLLQQLLPYGQINNAVQKLFLYIPSSYWHTSSVYSLVYEQAGVKVFNNARAHKHCKGVNLQIAIREYLCPWVIEKLQGHITDSIFNSDNPNEYPLPQDPRLCLLLTMAGSPSIQCIEEVFFQVMLNIKRFIGIYYLFEPMPIIDLTNHHHAVLKLLYTLVSADQFGTGEMYVGLQRIILLLFLHMVQFISPLPLFICQDWCTPDLAAKFVQLGLKDDTWLGLEEYFDNPTSILIHHLFWCPPLMNKAFEYAAAEHLFQVDRVDKALQSDCYSVYRTSQIIKLFIDTLMTPSSKLDSTISQKFLKYLFNPDTLFAVCIPLVGNGSRKTLYNLLHLCPKDDTTWPDCLAELQKYKYPQKLLDHSDVPGILADLATFLKDGSGPFGTRAPSFMEQIPQLDVSPTPVTASSPKNLWHRVQQYITKNTVNEDVALSNLNTGMV
ncbi:hypothetical protein EDD85DRAFT_522103 [Armillaria nabsnona]|nr:hypothetical protein EDD85DRAFT_522103 [Armillaria nabsnona]